MPTYITPKGEDYERGIFPAGFYEFSKEICLASDEPMEINIFATERYKLFVNGEYVCEGPCRSAEFIRYYDTVLCHKFRKGTNTISVLAAHLLEIDSYTTGFKKLKPMLLFEAKNSDDSICSDASWSLKFLKNHTMIDRTNLYVFPFESYDDTCSYEKLEIEEFRSFDFETGYFAEWGSLPFRLTQRKLPMISPGEKVTFKIIKKGDGFVEFDAGVYVTANVSIKLSPDTKARVIYSECFEFPDGKRMRDDSSGKLDGHYDIICSHEKELLFTTYWYRAFRFIRIECENPENILSVEAYRYNYPLEDEGYFECSDENFNKMWDISRNTLLCCATDILVDCPYYEQQQYVMDCAIETAVLLRLTRDDRLVRKCIDEFASSQTASGLICANYPSSWTQLIPGFSFFWIFMLKDYLEYSADVEFAKKYTGTIDKILGYFENIKTADGLFSRTKEWDFVDWVPDWDKTGVPLVSKGQPNTIYALYLAYALKCAAYITEKCGRKGLSIEYSERYNSLRAAINDRLFVAEKGMFHDGGGTFSMHTIIWAIITDVVSGEQAKEMAKKLTDKNISKSSYAMNFYLFRALEKCGMYDEALKYFGGWQKMIDLHCTTWCENPDNPRSECHGWSSAPLYEFSAKVLGVEFSFDDEIIISPNTMGLGYAKGAVPTRHGIVAISWENKEGHFSINIKSPAGIVKKLTTPDGQTFVFEETDKSISVSI